VPVEEEQHPHLQEFPTNNTACQLEELLQNRHKRSHTVIKYSTALSGLLKAARKARTTSSLGKPISMMFATVASYSEPVTKEEAEGAGVELEV
jgi:hypothetical protein